MHLISALGSREELLNFIFHEQQQDWLSGCWAPLAFSGLELLPPVMRWFHILWCDYTESLVPGSPVHKKVTSRFTSNPDTSFPTHSPRVWKERSYSRRALGSDKVAAGSYSVPLKNENNRRCINKMKYVQIRTLINYHF